MARREKRQEKKKAKRAEKKKELTRAGTMGVAERLARAASAPVLDCGLYGHFDDQGITQLHFSRQLRNGEVAMANLLVDFYCLGVKDGFGRVVSLGDYRKSKRDMESRHAGEPIDPPTARRLVEDAIAYAHRYGFEPHPDARKALPLFGDIDPSLATRTFEFGKDGKPFYIAGPHDSPARQRFILQTLQRTAGEGNFHFLMAVGADQEFEFLDDEDEFDDEQTDEEEEHEDESESLVSEDADADERPTGKPLIWYGKPE